MHAPSGPIITMQCNSTSWAGDWPFYVIFSLC
uniref:Uncharacterized protein n=1 Tax=Anguilla anguilla TaxID=7936 RepID=A0A0E9QHE5_ANGAN